MTVPSTSVVIAAIGNTTCRLALVDASGVRTQRIFTHAVWLDGEGVSTWLQEHVQHAGRVHIGVCSVVPRLDAHLERLCHAAGTDLLRLQSGNIPDMRILYDDPATLGADRLCAAYGARTLHGAPVIAVDFGTAITINVVDKDGAFAGGAILPGYALSMEALHRGTALLPREDPHPEPPLLGRSTVESIRAGVMHVLSRGIVATVADIARQVGAKDPTYRITGSDTPLHLPSGVPLVCTGGGAEEFLRICTTGEEDGGSVPASFRSSMQQGIWTYDPDLVVRGAGAWMRAMGLVE